MGKIKPKINLLTFNSALSYGAVLQTYALVKTLEKMDCEVEIIDFRAPFLPPIPTGFWSLKTYYNFRRLRQEFLFGRFRAKHLANKTKSFYTIKALKKHIFNADFYIVGSDQVWNPDITKKYALNYFFDFVEGSKIAYAASFGSDVWEADKMLTERVRNNLDKFQSISCREQSGESIISNIFNLEAKTVLDPTLLLADYSKLITKTLPGKLLICFKVNYDNDFFNFVSKIRSELNIPTIYLATNQKASGAKSIPYPTVNEWLSYMKSASFIITDSFHGVAFSIIFQKNFIVVNTNIKRFGRIYYLLDKLQLKDRVINDYSAVDSSIVLYKDVDYNKVNLLLEKSKSFSLSFLEAALK